MLVKDIIERAARLLNICAASFPDGEETGAEPDMGDEERERLLVCLNFTVDEVARDYFPLVRTQKIETAGGKALYSDFERKPTAVYGVEQDGRKLSFSRLHDGLKIHGGGTVEIEYAYAPLPCTEDSETEWKDGAVSERILAYGTAAEYCISCGLEIEAQMWDKRYRDALERAVMTSSVGRKIPARRWMS